MFNREGGGGRFGPWCGMGAPASSLTGGVGEVVIGGATVYS